MARGDKQFLVRIPDELREKLVAQAERNKRSINGEIIAAIELATSFNPSSINHFSDDLAKMLEKIVSDELAKGLLSYGDVLDRLDEIEKKLLKIKTH